MMWAYFWMAALMLGAGALLFGVGAFFGMFMMSVALSDDDGDHDHERIY